MSPSEPEHRAPEGAYCAQHPQRAAAYTCPRCGNYNCELCWHAGSERCDACLRRDPTGAAPPMPWETSEGGALRRYFATLATALHPNTSAPAFARDDLRNAFRFFLLSALPCAALSGIIPNTKTLLFGGSLQLIVQGHPTATQIALDVLIAMLMQTGAFLLDMLAMGLPYTTLVRAYAPERRAVAVRVLFYRSWLVPAATLLFFTLMWCLPTPPGNAPATEASPVVSFLLAIQFVMNLVLLISMRSGARLAAGVTPALSYVIVIVAFIVRFMVQLFVETAARGLLPKS